MYGWSRRLHGEVLEPGRAMMHNQRVLVSVLRFEKSVERWSSLDTQLTDLACAAVSARIGCSWCIDFGWYVARGHGLTESKPAHVADWRGCMVFSRVERRVLEYAEGMTSTPPTVTVTGTGTDGNGGVSAGRPHRRAAGRAD
ncbi:MAG: carboxymuconolactone decarboxylase family protein [Terracoccus sp.]